MRQVFQELKRNGKTIFLVTHNLEEVTGLCDRVGMMSGDRLIHEDTPEGMRRMVRPEAIGIELADGRRDLRKAGGSALRAAGRRGRRNPDGLY